MHRFLRWYNENRIKFWMGLGIIAFIFVILQVFNQYAAMEFEQKKNNISNRNSSTNESTTISKTEKSVITGKSISKTQDTINLSVIKQFVDYCNNKEIDKAYDMLTDECKEIMYPTLRWFGTEYWNRIFYIERMYKLENWYSEVDSYTYYITYTEDVLASGNVNSDNNKGDYITVVKQDEDYKLNINMYVKREISGANASYNGVDITINYVDIYTDYCKVNISIKNNTENTICLDTKEKLDTIYLYDQNGVAYTSFLNENSEEEFIVYKNFTKDVTIKFNMMYSLTRDISGFIFSDIVLNYDKYIEKSEGKNHFEMDVK